MILMCREVGALAAVLVCAASSIQPVDTAPLQKCPMALPEKVLPASLQIQPWNRVPTVVVSLDASRTERAVIATGLNANVISPQASERLKLVTVDGRVKIDALDSATAGGQAEVSHFKASTLDLSKVAFAVADVPGLLSLNPHPDAPATWLGTPFLSAFQVTIDSAAQSVMLANAADKIPRTRQTSVAPLKLKDNRPYATVAIPGAKPFLALIDTASPGTVIPTEIAEKLKLKPVNTNTISRAGGVQGKVAMIEVPKLSIGKAEWKKARVSYLTSDSSKEFDRTFAVIGMDFICQFKVTFDFAHKQIALTPPEKKVEAPAAP